MCVVCVCRCSQTVLIPVIPQFYYKTCNANHIITFSLSLNQILHYNDIHIPVITVRFAARQPFSRSFNCAFWLLGRLVIPKLSI